MIEIKERDQLEPLLARDPETIGPGMKILARQFPTDTGPLDILAADTDGTLVVIELKDEIDDGQLDQGLRYYDWARSNIAWLARTFPDVDAELEPKLMLIAPGFSDNLKRVAKYTTLAAGELLELREYLAFDLNGEVMVITRQVEIPEPSRPPEYVPIPEKIKKIEDETMRALCRECLDQLEKSGVELRPLTGDWISGWFNEKQFIYIGCKKHFFTCGVQRLDDTWTGRVRINSKEVWDKLFGEDIAPRLSRV